MAPNGKKNGRRPRRSGRRRELYYTNKVIANVPCQTGDTDFSLKDLLGPDLDNRKVILKSFHVQILPPVIAGSRLATATQVAQSYTPPQVQLKISGPIWTSALRDQQGLFVPNFVPQTRFKQMSAVNPTNYRYTAFAPTMKVPLDSADEFHLLRVSVVTINPLSDGNPLEASGMNVCITTHVKLIVQETLTEITPAAQSLASSAAFAPAPNQSDAPSERHSVLSLARGFELGRANNESQEPQAPAVYRFSPGF